MREYFYCSLKLIDALDSSEQQVNIPSIPEMTIFGSKEFLPGVLAEVATLETMLAYTIDDVLFAPGSWKDWVDNDTANVTNISTLLLSKHLNN